MKNDEIKVISVKRNGDGMKFKMIVKVKEDFFTRLSGLFTKEKEHTVWMTSVTASELSNYIYREMKPARDNTKKFVKPAPRPITLTEGKEKENIKTSTSPKPAVTPAPEKAKRKYHRKPRKPSPPAN